jgi:YegS/Rv2252/BmrU family lipid kinase
LDRFHPQRVRICVIFNPAARGDKARHFREHLATLDTECALKPTPAAGAGRTLAAAAVREGFDVIVAAGGDGTLNEVLNGIGDEPEGFERVRVAALPLGTANVFARELGLPLNFHQAWRSIRQGHERHVDLGVAEFQSGGQSQRRYFAQLGGVGLDARAVELVSWHWKKKAGFVAYVRAGLQALREDQPSLTVTGGGRTLTGELALFGNGRLYGGPFALFPDADPSDGQLDVRVFPRADWRTALACAMGLLTGRVGRAGRSRDFRADSVEFTSSARAPLELDGEAVGELPARCSVRRQALRVLGP